MRFEDLINKKASRLSENDTQLLSYLITHRDSVMDMTSREISNAAFTSPATLTRVSQKLGFNGFSELRYFLKHEGDGEAPAETGYMTSLVNDMTDTISLLEQTNLTPLVKAIHNAKRVYLYGTDWGEKRACELLARNFLACRLHMYTVPSITEFKWALNDVGPEDLIIVIFFSGENDELIKSLLKLELHKTPFISITPLSKNSLSSRATFNLYYVSTQLRISAVEDTEYNYFSTLEYVSDALFRYFLDIYKM